MEKEKAPKEKKELTPEQKVKQNRLYKLIYLSIVGGMGLSAMVMFGVAQWTKAKLDSSDIQVMAATNVLNVLGPDAIKDQTSVYHDKAIFFNDQYNHYKKISERHLKEYTGFSITAYTLSILTLVSFGLVLKHSDARKEKED